MKLRIRTLPALLLVTLLSCHNGMPTADAYGNFESEPVLVSAEQTGKITGFFVERGMVIEEGYLAAQTDTGTLHLQIRQLEAQKGAVLARNMNTRAQISVLDEQKKNLRTNIDRVSNMLREGAATQKQYDDLTSQLDVLDKQPESARVAFSNVAAEAAVADAQVHVLQDQLRKCRIITPLGGTVLETYARNGEWVMAGKPLFKIADLSELTLKAYISGAQLPLIKLGDMADVFTDNRDESQQPLTGKITWISAESEFTPKNIQTREERVKLVYAIKVTVPNDGTLKIGMPGEVFLKHTN
jgi:HlyD family secretion protein